MEFIIKDGLSGQGDERLLRVMLENLLGNAWKFTAKRPQARVEFGTLQQGGKKVYFVCDNGAGFDIAYAEKLFGPFQRLHARIDFEGTESAWQRSNALFTVTAAVSGPRVK